MRRLMTLADDARKSVADGELRIGELSERLEGSLPGATKTIEELEASLAEATRRRDEAAHKLPSRLYRRYASVASRGKTPVAKTHDGTCLGCFVQLPPMLFHQMLSRTEFGECPFCHRIIYYAPKPEKGEAPEPEAPDQTTNEASS
jgi:predicted  nucleic acid-binding Zn-ribbon protein